MKSACSLSGGDSPRDRFTAMLPKIREVLSYAFRELTGDNRLEAIQDCLASVWEAYSRLVAQGRESIAYPTVLALFAVKRYRVGRRFVGKGRAPGSWKAGGDLMSPTSGAKVVRAGDWRNLAVEDKRTSPGDVAALRIDFAAWLRRLPRMLRKIAKRLAIGERTMDAARRFQLSSVRISQLRRELELNWEAFRGEAV